MFVLEYQEATRTFQGVCRVVLEEEPKKMGLSMSQRKKKNSLDHIWMGALSVLLEGAQEFAELSGIRSSL